MVSIDWTDNEQLRAENVRLAAAVASYEQLLVSRDEEIKKLKAAIKQVINRCKAVVTILEANSV